MFFGQSAFFSGINKHSNVKKKSLFTHDTPAMKSRRIYKLRYQHDQRSRWPVNFLNEEEKLLNWQFKIVFLFCAFIFGHLNKNLRHSDYQIFVFFSLIVSGRKLNFAFAALWRKFKKKPHKNDEKLIGSSWIKWKVRKLQSLNVNACSKLWLNARR